jgi:hypothetical protein
MSENAREAQPNPSVNGTEAQQVKGEAGEAGDDAAGASQQPQRSIVPPDPRITAGAFLAPFAHLPLCLLGFPFSGWR